MNEQEFCEWLANDHPGKSTVLTLKPGPVKLRSDMADKLAGQLLLWLFAQMPDEATTGDLLDVLDCARWWHFFWASLDREDMGLEATNA